METTLTWKPFIGGYMNGYPALPHEGLSRQIEEEGFDLIINVSDNPMWPNVTAYAQLGVQYFWFPMGDCVELGLQSIYGALLVLHQAELQGKKVLLHCAAAVSRSQTVWDCYVFMRTGVHRKWFTRLQEMKANFDDPEPPVHQTMLHFNAQKSQNTSWAGLPSIEWMERWLTALGKQLEHDPTTDTSGTFDTSYLAAEGIH